MSEQVDLSGSNKVINLETIEEIKQNPDYKWQLYLTAKYLAGMGLNLVPLVPNGKSLPGKEYNMTYGAASSNIGTIEKWFHPSTGKFAGWNLGLATGKTGGVFVIDVDVHGDVDGHKVMEKLEHENGKLPPGPVQRTPSGGAHYVFMWQENAASSTGKIAKSIDTRGGEDNACKGHVVVFPSKIKGKQYEWIKGGEIPLLPPWVTDKLGVAWRNPLIKNPRGNENVGDEDLEVKIPLDQVIRMLEYIDPNSLSYEQWLKIGQAINTQHPEEGLKVWDDWSRTGKRYKNNECSVRWNGFRPDGPVRMGTLFYYAKNGGWKPTEGDKFGSKYDEIVEKMNQEFAITVIGNKVKIIMEKSEANNPVARHFDLLSKEDFKTFTENDYVIGQDAKGNPKKIPTSQVWLSHEGRRTFRNGIGLFPNGAPDGYYNTWRGFSVEPELGNCEKFKHMIRNDICNGDETRYEWTMDWIADMFQDPANPKGTAIVMRGEEGVGKGILANTIGELFGAHYIHLIDANHLTGQFNSHMMDAVFLFADEITWGGYADRAGKLKGLVTEKFLLGEKKGIDAVRYRNMIHMMIASNERWVVPAGPTSRRWFVLDVSDRMMGNQPYFAAIMIELDSGGKEAFLHEMLTRKITNDLTRAPETEALQEQRMMSMSQDTVVQWWIHCVESSNIGTLGEWPRYMDKDKVYAMYEEWAYLRKKRPESQMVFYKQITRYGVDTARPRELDRKRVFELPTIEDAKAILHKLTGFNLGE